jgi:hypothetical protein
MIKTGNLETVENGSLELRVDDLFWLHNQSMDVPMLVQERAKRDAHLSLGFEA